jgi:HAD superfamily hydrolase (TIGR01509 family)
MPAPTDLDFVFFDIGGTLGEYDAAAGRLVPFPDSARLLRLLRDAVGLRLGVITTLADLSNDQGRALLAGAGLAEFLDPAGFVSDHDAGVAKPDPAIYRFAAAQAGAAPARCLYVGDDLAEVIGARAAGMQALLRPAPPRRPTG